MLAVISPAKSLDFSPAPAEVPWTQPEFLSEAEALIDVLRQLKPAQLSELMGISAALAELNATRYRDWHADYAPPEGKQAVLAFTGDVYRGLNTPAFKKAEFTYAQKHLRILSGLYGVLRPLDLILPYRLEMGTRLKTTRGSSLYDYWGSRITEALNTAVRESKSKWLVNLASEEYFSAVKPAELEVPVVNCVFKDEKNGRYKIISFYAKKARGLMADYMIRTRAKLPEDLHAFATEGYRFDPASSTKETLVFLRPAAAAAV